MSVNVRGDSGHGLTTVYTGPDFAAFMVETLKFQIDTDGTAGVHRVRVRLVDPVTDSIATLDDLNNGGPGQTNYYTFGLGLNASACTITTGMASTDALPWTSIDAQGWVTVMPMNDNGVEIAGDVISNVVLQVDYDQPQTEPLTFKVLPPYTMAA